jgi:1,4-dihydroxy-2-naphthoate octaprenyltransferase
MMDKNSITSKTINIIGQARIYSLVDLILFAYAIEANKLELTGIVLLHLSFLFYLEHMHKHAYRLPIPIFVWIIFGFAGIILYSKLAVVGFIIASILYVRKNQSPISFFSPIARGFQYYFLAAGILGFANPISFLALALSTVRNFAGDLRDIEKDKKEKTKTSPVIMGIKKDYKNVHLLALFVTSFVWWYIAGISIVWLFCVYLIQIFTYNITPRK